MTQRVSLSIEQWMALREGGAEAPPIWFSVVGNSMFPLIRVNRDQVMLVSTSPEDIYLYLCAHEYKHYSSSGTGLRSVLDTYVYLQNVDLDMEYVSAEAQKLGMAEFESANRSLAQHLFSGQELTEADEEMLDYILSSGVYGTTVHWVENAKVKYGYGKAGFFWTVSSRRSTSRTLFTAYR